jgi:ferric-dicitrate binding protein FerR (iron transport regulator)
MESTDYIRIIKYLDNELSLSEKAAFEAELLHSESMQKILEETKLIFDAGKKIECPDFDIEKALNNVNHQLITQKHKKHFTLNQTFAIAASFAAIVFSIYFLYNKFGSQHSEYVEVYCQQGQKINITLPGKVQIWLNSGTCLRYPSVFTNNNKNIYIDGEAYIETQEEGFYGIQIITRNNIFSPDKSAFNVINSDSCTELTVQKGTILATNNASGDQVLIDEGYKASSSTQLPLAVYSNNNRNFLAWKTGNVQFENTDLFIVANTVKKAYGINIEVGPNIRYCPFSASYNRQNIHQLINDIKKTYNLQVTQKEKLIILSGTKCST